MAIRGVIFDLDGTLVDTNRFHVEAWHKALADRGYTVPRDRLRPEMGKGGDTMLPAVIGEDAAAKDGKALKAGHEKNFAAIAGAVKLHIFPRSFDLIGEIRDRGVRTALATSSNPGHLKSTFTSCGVDFSKLMDDAADAGDTNASKPAPDLVHAALAKLGLPAAECAMIGDTPFDGIACGQAGVRFWAVLCGGTATEAELRQAGAKTVFRDPADLLAHLDDLLGKG